MGDNKGIGKGNAPNSLKNLRPQRRGEPPHNPEGGRAHNKQMKQLKKAAVDDIVDIGKMLLDGNLTTLQDIINDSKSPDSKHSALKVWMATIAFKGIAKGDPGAMDALLNRIVGKAPDNLNLIGSIDNKGSVEVSFVSAKK